MKITENNEEKEEKKIENNSGVVNQFGKNVFMCLCVPPCVCV